ncbi:MAG: hypothetical protein EU533_00815 [Promethearchaeota archaeon]|nr:MAG: hypothetical protein EU533_00815 [Candidatus Lokiarchaeota archaeon]
MKFINKNRIFLAILLFSVSLISSSVYFLASTAENNDATTDNEEEIPYVPPEPDPIVELIDFGNGTTKTTIDYQNGVTDVIIETMLVQKSTLQLDENVVDQELEIELPTSTELSTKWVPYEIEVVIGQEFLMGFSYSFYASRTVVDLRYNIIINKGYIKAGYTVDIGIGLRLPVRIILSAPDQMTVGHDYRIYATLDAYDKPNYNEWLCKFKAYLWVEAGEWFPFVGWTKWKYTFGPNYDFSKSFETPMGSDSFPIPEIPITIWDIWVLAVKLVIVPQLGCDKFRATKTVTGDARLKQPQSSYITWTDEGQIWFWVHAENYDSSTDQAKIKLSDFRYYFSKFHLHFDLLFDICDWIDWLTGDPRFRLFTLDMSWLTEGLYLRAMGGEPPVNVQVFVERYGVDVDITPKNLQIRYGETGTYKVMVRNTGNILDTFKLEIDGSKWPNNVYTLETSEVTLNPGQYTYVNLYVTQGYPEVGSYDFLVKAYSVKSGMAKWDTVQACSQVVPYYGVDVLVIPQTNYAKPSEIVEYTIEVTNLGNVEDTYDILLDSVDLNLDWAIVDKTTMILGPGESDIAIITISVPSDWAGMNPSTYPLNVTAISRIDPLRRDRQTPELIVLPTKESKARYIDIELESLTEQISDSTIDEDVKTGLLDKLTAAIEKKEQALNYIIEGKMKLANNMLKACQNIMEAYLSLIEAQFGKAIPEHAAYDWEYWGKLIIEDIDDTIATTE